MYAEAWKPSNAWCFASGNGLRPIEESGADYARFHGRDENYWPLPIWEAGAEIAKHGYAIAEICFRPNFVDTFVHKDRFVFLPHHLRIANVHEAI